ncbi:MAG: polysaccharide deacetylase [Vicinamibacteria bacterium]
MRLSGSLKAVVRSTLALAFAVSTTRQVEAQPVKNYEAFFAECSSEQCGRRLVVLRTFSQQGEKRVLTVDPATLETSVRSAAGLDLKALSWPELRIAIASDRYGRASTESERNGHSPRDAGLTHALPAEKGVVLTMDLCPSTKHLDRQMIKAVIDAFEPEEKPVPIGIAITGCWMRERPAELAWLRDLEARGDLAVTWINHSFNHRYTRSLPLAENFLLKPGTDLGQEILGTEKMMLESGLRPSVFFRFPGLVSNFDLVQRVTAYGLVPVGSDAWLAKNQIPTPGSIVLVHGNGNEELGIKRLLALIHREKSAIRSRNWLLFDLRESVTREEPIPQRK